MATAKLPWLRSSMNTNSWPNRSCTSGVGLRTLANPAFILSRQPCCGISTAGAEALNHSKGLYCRAKAVLHPKPQLFRPLGSKPEAEVRCPRGEVRGPTPDVYLCYFSTTQPR